MKVLFICNQNENRSRTAEEVFGGWFETMSAGLYNEKPVSEQQMNWADIIVVMEESQRKELANRFPKQYLQKRILSLDIPDIYYFNQPELVEELKKKMNGLVKPLIK
ncbi:phosphotyrosine protein phosphatase [Candidatus Woesearchaeota archaeon]|nr:phosphotyrosine protein phosphatase [Candidatus Woesearchaeota archaeon]